VQSLHCFEIVPYDCRASLNNHSKCFLVALEVRNEDLHRARRNELVNPSNGLSIDPGTAIWELIAINTCDHHML
jgi:hypothetical protein